MPYDPNEFNADDVIDYLDEHPESAAEVLRLEQGGKARVTVIAAAQKAMGGADASIRDDGGNDAPRERDETLLGVNTNPGAIDEFGNAHDHTPEAVRAREGFSPADDYAGDPPGREQRPDLAPR